MIFKELILTLLVLNIGYKTMGKNKETVPISKRVTCTFQQNVGTYFFNFMSKIEYKNGEKIGDCIFLKRASKIKIKKYTRYMAIFKCQCGKEFESDISRVKNGCVKSCGCLRWIGLRTKHNEGDMVGNCIYVKDIIDPIKSRYPKDAIFICECGKQFIGNISNVKKYRLKHCGLDCPSARGFIHGECKKDAVKSSEYNTWINIKNRCYYKKHNRYHNYGGRGIIVCNRWLNSFKFFLQDMGEKPTPKHSIDRIDVNGNYEPSNCSWATPQEQGANTTTNVNITCNGETKCLAEWSRVLKMGEMTLKRRLRNGWSIRDAITIPVRKKSKNS